MALLLLLCLFVSPFVLAEVIFKDGFESAPTTEPETDPPPDPATVAPPNPDSGVTTLFHSTEFLYTGEEPIQTGVEAGTIEPHRVAIIRGLVTDRSGDPLSGVAVTILGHPQFGQTLSRTDGRFDLAVNGGGALIVNFAKTDFLPAQREIQVPWRDWVYTPDTALVQLDSQVTTINLDSSEPFQVAQGSPETDDDGPRQATLLFPQGTTAELVFSDGSTQSISQLDVRGTEYTVGPNGPRAMPAELPETSGYTYALELSADEAISAGASSVQFSQPLPFYLENFLEFPVGGRVPAGYYDRERGDWLPSDDGRIIEVLTTDGGTASIDVDGDGAADSGAVLTDLGITDAELEQLAQLYTAGTSLWRVPIEHFTPWDCNWPYGPPDDAGAPPDSPPDILNFPGDGDEVPDRDDPCEGVGSIIECQSQTLRESIPLAGTGFTLNYRSDRVRPGKIDIELVVSEGTVPTSLKRIEVGLEIAGRDISAELGPDPDQVATLSWDGKDAYGRDVEGAVPATVRVVYWYDPVYYPPGDFEQSFGRVPSGTSAIGGRSRGEVGISRVYSFGSALRLPLGVLDARVQGLGGWTVDVQHAYDANEKTLFLGDGTRRREISRMGLFVVEFIDALEEFVFSGDVFRRNHFKDRSNTDIDFAADGTVYVGGSSSVDSKADIVRIRPNGEAESLQIPDGTARDIALHPDGAIYYVNPLYALGTEGPSTRGAILRLFDPDPDVKGDEQNAVILEGIDQSVDCMKADSQGGLYFCLEHQVRYIPPEKVGPDPITLDDVLVVAGTGVEGFGGDGGPALDAQLDTPTYLELGPDGSLFIADIGNDRVRRIDRDGVISTVAGNGTFGNAGDGLPATEAEVRPGYLALDGEGGLYISSGTAIRYVRPDGIIVTVAGDDRQDDITQVEDGFSANRLDARFRGVAMGPDGLPYAAGNGGFASRQGRLVRLVTALPGFTLGDRLVSSRDGSRVYAFNVFGRHLQTIDALTGQVRHDFSYDAGGWLTAIADSDGNITTIERDADGVMTAIVSPDGLRTDATINDALLLTQLTNPENETFTLTYDSISNKLSSLQNPRGQVSAFSYNNRGRLIRDEDGVGGFSNLSRSTSEDGTTVMKETAEGAVSAYEAIFGSDDTLLLQNATPTGAVYQIETQTDGTEVILRPDGVEITSSLDPDPRFGAAAPLLSRTLQTPAGRSITYSKSRSVTLVDHNFLDVESLEETVTTGSRAFTRTFDKAARTVTVQTPSGLQQVRTYDDQWRLVELQSPGLAPRNFSYNENGDVSKIEQGGQFLEFGYDTRGRINAVTDAAGRVMNYAYDSADRLVQAVLPSGRIYISRHDNAGNRTTIQMPDDGEHMLGYSPVDLLESYTNPSADEYSWSYDLDRKRTQLVTPSLRTMDYSYDPGGRIVAVTYPEATVDYGYADATQRLTTSQWTPTGGGTPQSVTFEYDGHLVVGTTYSGLANGAFSYSYDSDLKLTGVQLGLEAEISTQFNADGLLVAHGPFTISRDAVSSFPSEMTDGTMSVNYSFDSLGRLVGRTHVLGTTTVYELQLDYDLSGRLQGRTETVDGVTNVFSYAYDADEELTAVEIGGVLSETYGYDVNGNRTEANGVAATYDASDRLTQAGATSYVFGEDGFLSTRGSDSFTYSARGELLTATVGGTQVDYTYDAMARRVARTDSAGTTQYLYGNPATPFLVTHSRAPDGTLTTYFYSEAGLLNALERDNQTFYVAVDQVGSPRLVIDEFGSIVKEVTYSAFGEILSDSNPSFELAVGFGGGIPDSTTGLVRFGMRDYDPQTGRWTARDPILFTGGPNLYMYAANNPVLKRDPTGLYCTGVEAYAGIGGGIELCYKDGEWSYCSEVGFGAGGGLKLTPFGDVAERGDNLFLKGEVVAGLGPLEAGGEFKTNDCGTSLNSKCGTFLIDCGGQVSSDVEDLSSEKKVGDAYRDFGRERRSRDGSFKAGLSAKLTAGACLGSKLL